MAGKQRSIDMLNGTLWNKILIFALPLAATSMLQQLFNAADIAVVGNFVGKDAMAAVGSNAPLISLLINLFVGISIGSNVVIARFTGQGQREDVSNVVHTSIVVALAGGLLVTAVGELVTVPALELLGVPDEVMDYAVLYLRILFIGMPFTMLYNFESAVFRSQGDTRTPLICLVAGGIINVLLNLFFVLVLKMSVEGVAIATITANIISSGLLLYFLTHRDDAIKVELKKLKVHGYALKSIAQIGVPSGIQGMVFSISNISIQTGVNSLGADVMAGSSAAFNVEILVYFIVNAFGQACVSFTSQNYGAGNHPRCKRVFKVTLGLEMLFTIFFSMLLLLVAKPVLGFFNGDAAVITAGFIRLKFLMTTEVFNASVEIFSGALRGLGQSMKPAIISIAGICGVRILWVNTIFKAHHTIDYLMVAYPISWAITAAVLGVTYYFVVKKMLINH